MIAASGQTFSLAETPYSLQEISLIIGADWRLVARFLNDGTIESCVDISKYGGNRDSHPNFYSILRFCCYRRLERAQNQTNSVEPGILDEALHHLAWRIQEVESLYETPGEAARELLGTLARYEVSALENEWLFGCFVPTSCALFDRSRRFLTCTEFSDYQTAFFFKLGQQLPRSRSCSHAINRCSPWLN